MGHLQNESIVYIDTECVLYDNMLSYFTQASLAYAWGDKAQAPPYSHVEICIQQMYWHQEHVLTAYKPQQHIKLT